MEGVSGCPLGRSPGRILVVETAGMSQAVAPMLAQGFEAVLTLPDGPAAIETFLSFAPDLVVLNLGYVVADRVQTWERTRSMAVPERTTLLVLSDSRSPEDEQAALDLGADDFLRKPVSRRRLTWRVRAMLRRHAIDPDAAHTSSKDPWKKRYSS